MGHVRRFATRAHASCTATLALAVVCSTAASAAPITVNGATFDAPTTCQPADGVLVCKVEGQQLELWVKRKPLAPAVAATDPFVRKTAYFTEVHQNAVVAILRSTSNDSFTPFTNYGAYSALGAAMPGKGVVTSPTVRFASVLHDEEIWEFLEVVAARTPAVEALSGELQRSLALPVTPVASATPVKPHEGSPLVATFNGKLLSLEHPGYLAAVVSEDTGDALSATFKHKTRKTGGPDMVISLRTPADKQTATTLVSQRKTAVTETMAGQTASVAINKLGDLDGSGFALIGTPDSKKGLSGIESFETTFASDINGRVLEVRLTAEQQYSSEAQVVWAMLAKSLKVGK